MAGVPPSKARAALIMVHGRGANAPDMLKLALKFNSPNLIYLAPQAADSSWFPNQSREPIASNEPWLSSTFRIISDLFDQLAAAGLPTECIFLLGFSQGACVCLEYATRHPRRYGGIFGLSGALMGPADAPRSYTGSLEQTPVFLGCSDVDSHIALERVQRAHEALERLDAHVTKRIYPGMGHVINEDEIALVQAWLAGG